MEIICSLNERAAHYLELFLESTVPLIASVAEVIGLFIIVISLAKATYHYIRVTLFHDHHDFHHEMSSGLTTALEFLMSAEIAKTFLLPSLQSVIPLAATFALRAMMSLLLHAEMHTAHDEELRREERALRQAKRKPADAPPAGQEPPDGGRHTEG